MAKDPELQALEEKLAALLAENARLKASQGHDVDKLERVDDYKGFKMLKVSPKGQKPFNMSVRRFETLVGTAATDWEASAKWAELYEVL